MATGSQTVTGTEGNDTLKVNGNSADQIFGLGGNDNISGGAGNDLIEGGSGDDIIDGGAHDDIIDGGAGNDILTGGAHADTFVIGADSGVDTITDFRPGEDVLDLSGSGVHDLAGRVTNDANGNAVIDLGDGNSVTLLKISAEMFLADPSNFVLADPPVGPVQVFLGINDTYADAGDGVDHLIDGDSNGEEDTDTDAFIFGPNNGDDMITDFRFEDVGLDEFGVPFVIPGDTLDLGAYGIFGADLGDGGFVAYFDGLVGAGLLSGYTVTSTDTVLNFTAGDSLTLLGIGENEIGTVIELNMARDTGGGV